MVYFNEGRKKSYTTLECYINYIYNFYTFYCSGNTDHEFYKKVKPTDIETYLISLETKTLPNGKIVRTGASIIATRYSALMTFFNYLADKRELIDKNPVTKVDRPKVNTEKEVVYLNKTEVNKVKNSIDKSNDKNSIRDKTILSLALATALRVSAISNINCEDINFDQRVINVIEKRNKIRQIPFSDKLCEILEEYIVWRNKTYPNIESDALFISNKKNRISTKAINAIITKYNEASGINKHLTAHCLRKSAATAMIKSGIELTTVSRILGHSSPSVTMRYVAEISEEKDKAVNCLDNFI